MKTIREFNQFLVDLSLEMFPYDETFKMKHILPDGTIEDVHPVWYGYLFNSTDHNIVLNIAYKKYGHLLIDESDYYEMPSLYDDDYFYGFLPSINETMYRLWDLFTEHINPYHNVDEHIVITNNYGEHVTETEHGEQNQTTTIGERVNETTYEGDTVTSTDKRVGQDAHTLKDAGQNVTTNEGKTDTTTLNKDGSTDTVKNDEFTDRMTSMNHEDTFTTERGGNIGVATNATLAAEHITYADTMKLYDMFLDQYVKYFSAGVWKI